MCIRDRFNTDTGVLTTPRLDVEAVHPAFFVIHPDGRHLYSVVAVAQGGVSAYAIDPKTAHLTWLNREPSGGDEPSYVCLDQTARFVLVANYDSGNVAAFALQPDGSIGARTALVQETGRSVNSRRQMHAYAPVSYTHLRAHETVL